MKRFFIITGAILAIVTSIPVYAKEGFNAAGGIKLIYSGDENIQQNYYKPFASIGWSGDLFDAGAAYYRWISYSVTDEPLNTKEIGINQAEIETSLYPAEILSLDLAYSYFTGDSSYNAHRIAAALLFDFDAVDISFDYSYKACEYEFGLTIENISQNASAGIGLDITDSLSWDITYDYDRTDYNTYGYIYDRHILRIGLVKVISGDFFMLGGISGSADSDDVFSAAADAGFTLKLYDHVKLGALYMFTAEFTEQTVSGGGGPGSSTTSIQTDLVHTGSISFSLYL